MNGFICESCDDPFLIDFGEDFEVEFKGKKHIGTLCLMCALRDKLDKISEKFSLDEIITENNNIIFTPVQSLLLDACVDKFNEKHKSNLKLNFFKFGIIKPFTMDEFENFIQLETPVCTVVGEVGDSIQIRYEHMAEAEVEYHKWMREEERKNSSK